MRWLVLVSLTVALSLCSCWPVFSNPGSGLSTLIISLLDEPAPPPPTIREVAEALAAQVKWPDPVCAPAPEPGSDAPPKVLLDYWDYQLRHSTGKKPSDEARWRLLDAVLVDPRFDSSVLNLLPDTTKAHEEVKNFLDRPPVVNEGILGPYEGTLGPYLVASSRRVLTDWLRRHSPYDRESLIKRSREAFEAGKYSHDAEDLEALATLDWNAASPIVHGYINDGPPEATAFSLGLLLGRSIANGETVEAESINERLKTLATDPSAPERARLQALTSLLRAGWPGGDEWLVTVLQDSRRVAERETVFRCVSGEVRRDPERWLPVLTRLIGHPNRDVHDCAVYGLGDFDHRVDAVMPLLPWLSDPNWATACVDPGDDDLSQSDIADQFGRLNLITSVATLRVTDSVPSLLSILQNEEGEAQARAAEALAELGEREAVPFILRAIERVLKQDSWAESLVDALLAFGLSDADKTRALEALSRETDAREICHDGKCRLDFDAANSVQGAIGLGLVRQEGASDALAESVLRRARELRVSEPSVSEKLWRIARRWEVAPVDIALAERIADGTADLDCLLRALQRRDRLRANSDEILRPLVSRGGYIAGLVAVLRGDESAKAAILAGSDKQALIGLFASGRLVREEINELLSGRFLKDANKLLRLACQRYLEAADTRLARQLLRENQRDVLIHGARHRFDPSEKEAADWEDSLRREMREGRADEVFGVLELTVGHVQSLFTAEIRVRGDRAQVCSKRGKGSSTCRALSVEELNELRALYDKVSFDDLPPVILKASHGFTTYDEFIRINGMGGRRVFARNLYSLEFLRTWTFGKRTPYELVDTLLQRLAEPGRFEKR